MKFAELPLKGAFVVELAPKEDERGFFSRTWCAKEFAAHGLDPHVVQSNLSYNRARGTLRGLHYQVAPHAEAKLVRCSRGAICDVIVDLRRESSTYLQWASVILTSRNWKTLYVPKGFAHGFQTLEHDTEVEYHVTQFYAPEAERGLRWDDPTFSITWPDVEQRVISARDRGWPPFSPLTSDHDSGR